MPVRWGRSIARVSDLKADYAERRVVGKDVLEGGLDGGSRAADRCQNIWYLFEVQVAPI